MNKSKMIGVEVQYNEASKQQLPLQQDQFRSLNITRDEVSEYVKTAKSILDEALSKAREDQLMGNTNYRTWKQLGSHAGFKRFLNNDKDLHYRLHGIVGASLNDLMGIMYADSTAQVIERRQILYKDSLDAKTLCVLKERSAENMHEHISIRWEAINLSNNSPNYRRDMCFLEYTGVVTDIDGVSVGFFIKQAIDRSECGSLEESHGLSRLQLTEILLFRPTLEAGHTEIVMDGVVQQPKNLPSWLVNSFLNVVAANLSNLPIIVQEKLLARLPMISSWQYVPLSCRKNCHVCTSKFRLLSKKFNCHSCGQVSCKSCIVTRTVNQTNKFCTKCILMVSTHGESIDRHFEQGSLSSSSDRSRQHRKLKSPISSKSTYKNNQSPKVPEMRVDIKLLTEVKTSSNNCSMSSTASETSFDDSISYSMDRRDSETLRYNPLGEEMVVETLDTTKMTRCAPRTISSSIPSVETVKDAIAHQQYILKEMLLQAKAYQQQKTRM
ncbi:putative Zinc finger, FYVE/PHD-type, Zinc finger, RING/FYVE/PHD-type [Plasmopara halstedii]